MAQLWIVAGPNGAGKTTLVTHRISARIPVVNPDAIAQDLPRIGERLDERQAGEMAIRARNTLLTQGADFAIETTLTGNSALRFIRKAKEAGYKLNLVYVGLSSATLSMQRVLDRVRRGGHSVPITAVERRYTNTMSKLGIVFEMVDRCYVVDNSDRRRRLLLTVDGGRTKFLSRDQPRWFVDALAHQLPILRSRQRDGG
jgi:predicted ABC-type ATPase